MRWRRRCRKRKCRRKGSRRMWRKTGRGKEEIEEKRQQRIWKRRRKERR